MLTDNQLLKYSRQIMLPKIDIDGQQKLLDSHVVVLGVGGLGSPVAMYLATAGVGELTLIDDDKVDLTNLQRQIIHRLSAIDKDKVESAEDTLQKLNPECRLNPINARLDEEALTEIVGKANIVVDCCDNFSTRFMLNRVCFKLRTPLVSGAAIRWEGQLSTFTMQPEMPCYRCIYEEDTFDDQTCSQNGVAAPLVGIIGSMQAMEAIKLITGAGNPISGRLMLFDALDMEWRSIKFKQRAGCPVCGQPA
ncbi:HesA/MoeB/ThiF family protein [Aliikangiella coralliicola]|uniref:Molybdopterin-synthase adenylyltransferase n=1 Tax=Aliikangiella coralliicola TaxID=2592383 RepID=A0A545TW37_9GAMM|nr:molybdopterin-synthase adenylyltransferase MoeB [Aliikangiella coralliicola]TQV81412.1 molybdopterin-synthase adenylyltransferase MoeB [Aliikangiella coralliicola]